jgi:hypothetical protein
LERIVSSRSWSALGFSQPLSGFLAKLCFAALFHAATVPETLPFRVFPSRRSRIPLGTTCSHAVIHHRAETHDSRPCHRRFHRLLPHARRRTTLARIPRRLWARFPDAEAPFPLTLGPMSRSRLVPLASPASKRYPLRESVHLGFGSPLGRRPILSWVSGSLELAPRAPGSLEPRSTDPAPPERDARPSALGEPAPRPEGLATNSSAASSPLRDWSAPALASDSCSPGLSRRRANPIARAFPTPRTSGAFQYASSGISLRRGRQLF